MMKTLLTALALADALFTGIEPLSAGTVITDHLPANTAIINIDATQDGANGYNGGPSGQAFWFQPFSNGTLAEYTVAAGTYEFRVIDPADAAHLFPLLTPTETGEIYTGWTYNSPWIEDYLVFDSAALEDSSLSQIFDGAQGPGFANAIEAYDDSITNNYYNVLRTAVSGGRDSTNLITSYTFTTAETLVFVIPDPGVSDNQGGVSVVVSPTGPVLSIVASAGQHATISWTPATVGYVLQESTNLASANWINSVSGATNPITVTAASVRKFYRLINP